MRPDYFGRTLLTERWSSCSCARSFWVPLAKTSNVNQEVGIFSVLSRSPVVRRYGLYHHEQCGSEIELRQL